jgi:RNA polymerase sigma-70 factor, ECF subfamily
MADEPVLLKHQCDDRNLLERIRGGEIDRFAELIERHQRHVIRIVSRRVPADHVEEIAHDVFVRAYVGLVQFSSSVPLDHWLAGIAVRTCYDFWRDRAHEQVPVSALTHEYQQWMEQMLAARSGEAFEIQTRRQEAAEVLEWALGQLSAEQRAVLTLVHLEGRSIGEAADLLGLSRVTVKVRAYRARQALRNVLAKSHGST